MSFSVSSTGDMAIAESDMKADASLILLPDARLNLQRRIDPFDPLAITEDMPLMLGIRTNVTCFCKSSAMSSVF